MHTKASSIGGIFLSHFAMSTISQSILFLIANSENHKAMRFALPVHEK